MIFENYIQGDKQAFIKKIKSVASNLGISSDWLMAVIYKESRFNPSAVNAISGATGLIQFMPATAVGLGTTVAAIKQMDSVQQLSLIQRYYAPYASALNDYTDLYLATFFPRALGKPDTYVMKTDTVTASKIAAQNPGVDINKDGQITVAEFRNYCYNSLTSDIITILKKKIL
jgi:hypothetical protein